MSRQRATESGKALYIRMTAHLHRRVRVFAARHDRTLEDIGQAAITEYLDREEAADAQQERASVAAKKASA